MAQSNLVRYGTIALIIIFAIEIVAFLFMQNPYANIAPTPTPTPKVALENFDGVNATDGYVIATTNELLIVCNTTQDPSGLLKNATGVQSVSSDLANQRILIEMDKNSSEDETILGVKGILTQFCSPAIFKRAFVKLPDYLNFTSQDGKYKLLFSQDYQCLEQNSYIPCYAFVQSQTKANTTINLMVFVRLEGESVTLITAEEPRKASGLEFRVLENSAKVLEILGDSLASVDIPFEKRTDYTDESINSALNGSANLSDLQYDLRDEFIINSTENETLNSISLLSYVLTASISNSQIVAKVSSNFTNVSGVYSDLLALSIPKTKIQFPVSKLGIVYSTSEKADAAILRLFPSVQFKRKVRAQIIDLAKAQLELGSSLPSADVEYFTTKPSVGQEYPIMLSAVLQNGEVSYIGAQENTNAQLNST
ncbi:hypothetical protein HY989_00910 [Candidatus Micrarchaeota archaeon]|nr:hypothetical protein [Candidatus Micrarchaeota archaeon]